MEHDPLEELEAALIGRLCSVRRRDYDWVLDLGEGANIAVSVPWRIVSKGRIAFARDDHGQLFGLAAPVDGELEARKLLGGKPLARVFVHRQTADIALEFGPDCRVDVFNNSAGYEGWHARFSSGGKQKFAVALGGGQMAFFLEDT